MKWNFELTVFELTVSDLYFKMKNGMAQLSSQARLFLIQSFYVLSHVWLTVQGGSPNVTINHDELDLTIEEPPHPPPTSALQDAFKRVHHETHTAIGILECFSLFWFNIHSK